jgi:hypothetical protein
MDDAQFLEDYEEIGRSLCGAFEVKAMTWRQVCDITEALGHQPGDTQLWLRYYRAEQKGEKLPSLRRNPERRRKRARQKASNT